MQQSRRARFSSFVDLAEVELTITNDDARHAPGETDGCQLDIGVRDVAFLVPSFHVLVELREEEWKFRLARRCVHRSMARPFGTQALVQVKDVALGLCPARWEQVALV